MAPPAFSRETSGSRRELFPEIAPYGSGYMSVGDGHSVYWEQTGNPAGQAALFLHGGPGAGAGSVHRRFFDPRIWRVVLFDQRGAGRSRPLGRVEANSTPDLIADIEMLRRHLGIERWLLFGGSWGSTLALAYAQAHPDRVSACVLRGIFLGRESEVDWFLHGIRHVFPEAHAQFTGLLPEEERGDLLNAYRRRLNDPDPRVHGPAARAWSVYEGSCSTLLPHPELVSSFSRDRAALGLARIEAHYFAHRLFLPPEGLLGHMDRIRHIPAEIVQGRYDMVCPPVSALDLLAQWPAARLTMVPDAGHSALEPGTRAALLAALERFATA
ncbi:prolyl aminopeptidase [Acidisoma silvae]|uniref:Proline iminopeptidase n=1 Tax=Acidisoma silvae TaxID=2802396 RepID=A0A963YNT5_9PROT|nr:prolyl aminopeptidase [Acidisoma silvae]MCB8874255.1 prolyl aminopeptidase [Acidisoma silvae]